MQEPVLNLVLIKFAEKLLSCMGNYSWSFSKNTLVLGLEL